MIPEPFASIWQFRLVKVAGVEAEIDLESDIGITIHMSERFTSERQIGGRRLILPSRIGRTFVDTPGKSFRVRATGDVAVLQMRAPIERIRLIAAEDHDFDYRPAPARDGAYVDDIGLLRFAAASMRSDRAQQCPDRDLVQWIVRQAGGKPVDQRGGLPARRLTRVRDLVEECLPCVTVAAMAAEAALSPYHFSREFRRATGKPPVTYLWERRLARAMDLLSWTTLPVGEIAKQTGFVDASHLGKHLRAHLGHSASDIRAALLVAHDHRGT